MEENDVDDENLSIDTFHDDEHEIHEGQSSEEDIAANFICSPKRLTFEGLSSEEDITANFAHSLKRQPSKRNRKCKYVYKDFTFYMNDAGPTNKRVAQAFHAEVVQHHNDVDAHGGDPSIFMPPPQSLRGVLKMTNHKVMKSLIRAGEKELKNLTENDTFEHGTPTKETISSLLRKI